MEIQWVLWEAVVCAVEASFIFYLFSKQLGIAPRKRKYAIPALLVFVTVMTLVNLSPLRESIPARLVFAAFDVFLAVILFNKSIATRFFIGILPAVVSWVGNALAYALANAFVRVDLMIALRFGETRMIFTTLYIVICAVIYLIIANVRNKNALRLSMPVMLFAFLLVGLGIVAVNQLIEISASSTGTAAFDTIKGKLAFTDVMVLIVLIGILVLIEQLGKVGQRNTQYALEAQQAKLEQDYMESMTGTVETMRAWKHDLHHHIQAMQVLLEKNDCEALKEHLKELGGISDEKFDIVSTGNTMLDAIITSKAILAKQNQIAFSHSIHFSGTPLLAQTDLCSLLGNLLDNAIEACTKLEAPEKRYIELSVQNQKEMLRICVKNASTGDYFYKEEGLFTTKTGGNHGIGLRRVRALTDDVNGFCRIDAGSEMFVITVLLPFADLPQKEEPQ